MIETQENPKKAGSICIGWKEWLAMPDLKIPALKAKIDTGARTSALHTFSIEEFTANGQLMVRFGIHPQRKQETVEIFCEAPVVDQRLVKNSGGQSEKRYIIETRVVLGQLEWPIKISLTNRDTMTFRMLLGRTALRENVIIDPAGAYLTGRKLENTYRHLKNRRHPL